MRTLLEARQRLCLTQRQVADKAKIHINQYQKFERGARKITSSSFAVVSRVLRVLELDLNAFAIGGYAVRMQGVNCEVIREVMREVIREEINREGNREVNREVNFEGIIGEPDCEESREANRDEETLTEKVAKLRTKIVDLIKADNRATIKTIAAALSVTDRVAGYHLGELKRHHAIKRIGSDKGGYWEVAGEKLNSGNADFLK